MNAMTPFSLVAEQPITTLTRLDCSDLENVKDARHQLRACRTEADFANWAAQWGEPLCNRADDMTGMEQGDDTALAEAEADAERTGKQLEELQGAVRRAVKDLDDAIEGPADKFAARVLTVSGNLENAL